MSLRLSAAFLLLGFSLTIAQTLMVRELWVGFGGNELTIGLILGTWLLSEALGGGLLGRVAFRRRAGPSSVALLQIGLALVLPLSLYGATAVRQIAGVTVGQGVGLGAAFLSSLCVLSPVGLIGGAMFVLGAQAFTQLTGQDVPGVSRVYLYEALGSIVGGILFTYLLVSYLSSLQIVLLLVALNLGCALGLSMPRPLPSAMAAVLLVAAMAISGSSLPGTLQRQMTQQAWRGHPVVGYAHSVYGAVAVVQQAGQYTFFANSVPVLTTPGPDLVQIEELVHIPLLFVTRPRRVLIVGGGVGGVLQEILEYPTERVDYAEMDPLLIQMARRFSTPLTARELSDPRVHLHTVDGRLLVRQMADGDYDAVLVNLPYPSTLQLNRFYTAEFFEITRRALTPQGILVLTTPGSEGPMEPAMRDLSALVDRTLRTAFRAVVVVPGDTNLWIASPSPGLSAVSTEQLLTRWAQRGLPTQVMSSFHIRLKLGAQPTGRFWSAVSASSGREINTDLRPAGVLRGLAYWNALFSPDLTSAFSSLSQWTWHQLLPLLGLGVGCLLLLGWPGRSQLTVAVALLSTGFSGLAMEVIAIFTFQTLYGYVYQQVGLLTGTFMGGLGLGALATMGRERGLRRTWVSLGRVELALLALWAGLPLLLTLLYAHPGSRIVLPLLLALNGLGGTLVGSEFPLAIQVISSSGQGSQGASGLLYACDLGGAFAASVLVSVALIPVLGIVQTCAVVMVLKLVSLTGVVIGTRSPLVPPVLRP